MKNKKIVYGGILIAVIIIAVVAFQQRTKEGVFGGVGTRFPNGIAIGTTATVTQNKFTLGNAGSAIAGINVGTCDILANASITASSTKNFDCAASGVVASDKIFVTASALTGVGAQYVIKGAVASSTSGWITFSLINLTGGDAVPAATVGFGSSTSYAAFR